MVITTMSVPNPTFLNAERQKRTIPKKQITENHKASIKPLSSIKNHEHDIFKKDRMENSSSTENP
jgi:hypothetical protein